MKSKSSNDSRLHTMYGIEENVETNHTKHIHNNELSPIIVSEKTWYPFPENCHQDENNNSDKNDKN